MKKQSLGMVSVLLLSMVACVSTSKYKKLEADNGALKAQVTQLTADKEQLTAEKNSLAEVSKSNESQYQQLIGQLSQEVQEGNLKVTAYQNMLTVDVAEQIFFNSGSAKLKPKGQEVLKKVGSALAQYKDKMIRVVGHTDDVKLAKAYQAVFPTNWELSVIRATNVVRFLQEQCGVDPTRLIASGRAEYEPVAPNDTKEGRQKNRRIEIMLLDKQMVESMGAPKSN